MSGGTCSSGESRLACGAILALFLAGLLSFATACESLTTTAPTVASSAEVGTTEEVTTSAGAATTTPSPGSTAQSGPSSTVPATETTATGEPPDVYLDKSDFGRQVRLRVGDRVRIDLSALEREEVVEVEWRYEAIIVTQTDSGTSETGGHITSCWLELEAVAAGDVTVRAAFERSDGSIRIPWVGYLAVSD